MALAVWACLLTIGFTIVPGTIIARRCGLPLIVAVAAGAPVSYGVIGGASMVFPLVGVPLRPWTLAPVFALVWGLVWAFGRFVAPRLRPGLVARDDGLADEQPGRTGLLALAAGVGVGAVGIMNVGFGAVVRRGWGGQQNITGVWDALWHAIELQWIQESGDASPTRVGLIWNPEAGPKYYPTGWHAGGSLLHDVTPDTSTVEIYNVWAAASTAFAVPIAIAALGYVVARRRLDPARAAIPAAIGAAAAPMFHNLPYLELSATSVPNAVGLALAPVTAVLVCAATRDLRVALPAIVGCAGTAAVHPSGLLLVILGCAVWWAADAVWRPVRSRIADVCALGVVGGAGVLAASPLLLAAMRTTDSDGGLDIFKPSSRGTATFWGALLRSAFQRTDALTGAESRFVLVVFMVAGFAAVVWWLRAWWLIAVWTVVLLICANAVYRLENPFGDVLWAIGKYFYNSTHRFSFVLAMVSAVFVGLAGAGLVALLRGVALVDAPRRTQTGVALVLLLTFGGTVVGANYDRDANAMMYLREGDKAHAEALAAGGSRTFLRNGGVISPADVNAFRCLASQPDIARVGILNNPDQGSSWMYPLFGLKPIFSWYAPAPFAEDQKVLLWGARRIGADPVVDAMIRDKRIRYVIDAPPSYWAVQNGPVWNLPDGRPVGDPFLGIGDAPGLREVYESQGVKIYEVTASAPMPRREGWLECGR